MKNVKYYESVDELERNIMNLQFRGVSETNYGYELRIRPILFNREGVGYFLAESIHINLPEKEKTGRLEEKEYLLWSRPDHNCFNIKNPEMIKRIEKAIDSNK